MNLLAARDLCAGDTPGDMTAAHLISMTHMTPLSVLLRCGSVSFIVSSTYTSVCRSTAQGDEQAKRPAWPDLHCDP